MIDTRIVKDVSGQIDLCETFTYCDKLEYPYLGLNKTISDIVRIENRYIIYFNDETSFGFIVDEGKDLQFAVIENNNLIIYLYEIKTVLLQVETNTKYGDSVIDIIEGYKEGKPYSRFTYQEVEENN